MRRRPEIQINRFQLGVLLTELDKKFFDCIVSYNIYCSHCRGLAVKGIFVDEIFLTNQNDIKINGRCKICSTEVSRLFTFGHEEEFTEKANMIRRSIKDMAV